MSLYLKEVEKYIYISKYLIYLVRFGFQKYLSHLVWRIDETLRLEVKTT